jgi:hypothetical protein
MKKEEKEVQILNDLLNELQFVKKVIKSCETGTQLEIALNWMNRWKQNRREWIKSKKMKYLLEEFDKIEFFKELNNLDFFNIK